MFTWIEKCDSKIINGEIVAITDATNKLNQELVETISNDMEVKLDWHFAGGIGIIKTDKENSKNVKSALRNKFPQGKLDSVYSIKVYV